MTYKNTLIGKLPIWGQVIFWAFVVFVLYKIYRWFERKAQAGKYNAAVNESQTALNQLAQQGVTPTYGKAQYTSYADSLQGAFQGCGGAISANSFWNTVEPVFKAMKNDADVYALIAAYGVRVIDACGYWQGDFEGNLPATLSEKFSGWEGAFNNYSIEDINNILKKNGIVFSF